MSCDIQHKRKQSLILDGALFLRLYCYMKPTHPKVMPPREIARWGQFKEAELNVSTDSVDRAVKLIKQLNQE